MASTFNHDYDPAHETQRRWVPSRLMRGVESSGIAWTHLHPNVISDSILVTQPPIGQTGSVAINTTQSGAGS